VLLCCCAVALLDHLKQGFPVEVAKSAVYSEDHTRPRAADGTPTIDIVSTPGFSKATGQLQEPTVDTTLSGGVAMPIGTVGATSAAAAAATAAAENCAEQLLVNKMIELHGQLQIAESMRYQKAAVFRVPSSMLPQLDLLSRAMQEFVDLAQQADDLDAAAAAAGGTAATAQRAAGAGVSSASSQKRKRRKRRHYQRKPPKRYQYKHRRVDPIGGGRKQLKLKKLATVTGGASLVTHSSDMIGQGLVKAAGLPGVRMGDCAAIWGGKRPQVAHVDNSHGVVY
jgi:hypothetical protein